MKQNIETSRVTVRMPRNVKDWLNANAMKRGMSLNTEIILTIQEKMAAEAKFDDEPSAAETANHKKEV